MDIIVRVLNGDHQAYSILVDRYQNFVFTLAVRYLKNREDAEEVSQDVFVKAFRALAGFKMQSKFSTWLYTITTTTCITALRKKKKEVYSLNDERIFEIADSADSGMRANQVEQKSKLNMVKMAIEMLNPEDAEVLTLFYKAEQTLDEIAQILKKEPNAVKVQLHRARGRLKERIQKYFSEEIKDIY